MGGYGSTRWGYYSRRYTTDEVPCMEAATFALHPEGSAWSSAWGREDAPVRARITRTAEGLHVAYSVCVTENACTPHARTLFAGTVDETLPLDVKQNAYFFRCPGCGAHRMALYCGNVPRFAGRWRCRVCHNLGYASQLENRRPGGMMLAICAEVASKHGWPVETVVRSMNRWRGRTKRVRRARIPPSD